MALMEWKGNDNQCHVSLSRVYSENNDTHYCSIQWPAGHQRRHLFQATQIQQEEGGTSETLSSSNPLRLALINSGSKSASSSLATSVDVWQYKTERKEGREE